MSASLLDTVFDFEVLKLSAVSNRLADIQY